jgi:hypothetical protein
MRVLRIYEGVFRVIFGIFFDIESKSRDSSIALAVTPVTSSMTGLLRYMVFLLESDYALKGNE